MESKYQTVHAISPEITGFLETDSAVYKYCFKVDEEKFLESEMSAEFLAGIIKSLDESRKNYSPKWTGAANKEGDSYRINFFRKYRQVEDEEKLPPRSAFLDAGYERRDPYDILREPCKFSIEGQPRLSWESIEEVL